MPRKKLGSASYDIVTNARDYKALKQELKSIFETRQQGHGFQGIAKSQERELGFYATFLPSHWWPTAAPIGQFDIRPVVRRGLRRIG